MKFSVSLNITGRKIEDETFVFNRQNSHIHSFNKAGVFLWEKAQKIDTSDGLIDAFLQQYDVDIATATRDVEDFLHSLREESLIKVVI